ncbi:hypothetical protein TELCIR_03311 [Teladorsagia circumcincta]|uniref:Uncharacterized protein n=1 Tax=Teladorsagia circumcincta TaxID=45464 RepID=A0A2G9UWQ4_TELCI|nr:hypothetical protein TELCIR_03311 [Teladorsagia circumcincta]
MIISDFLTKILASETKKPRASADSDEEEADYMTTIIVACGVGFVLVAISAPPAEGGAPPPEGGAPPPEGGAPPPEGEAPPDAGGGAGAPPYIGRVEGGKSPMFYDQENQRHAGSGSAETTSSAVDETSAQDQECGPEMQESERKCQLAASQKPQAADILRRITS